MDAPPASPTAAAARHSPAAERNRGPILAALQRLLPARGRALEIASGTGQHVAFFAAGMPGWHWQPTEPDAAAFASIAAWCDAAGASNVAAPLRLDVRDDPWPVAAPWDAVYSANLLHISPWGCCAALMRGAAASLAEDGWLLTYGPYLEDEVLTAPGNLAFDADLRARDPAWGLRRRAAVEAEAAAAGLGLHARVAMPANNLLLGFRRAARR